MIISLVINGLLDDVAQAISLNPLQQNHNVPRQHREFSVSVLFPQRAALVLIPFEDLQEPQHKLLRIGIVDLGARQKRILQSVSNGFIETFSLIGRYGYIIVRPEGRILKGTFDSLYLLRCQFMGKLSYYTAIPVSENILCQNQAEFPHEVIVVLCLVIWIPCELNVASYQMIYDQFSLRPCQF